MSSKRLITAAAILPVLAAYIYFMPAFPFFLMLLTGVGMLAMREFYVMYNVPWKLCYSGVLVGGVLLYVSCRYPAYFLDGIFLGLFLLLFVRLVTAENPSGTMSEVGPLGVGFFYISGFLSFQWFLRTEVFGVKYLFLLYSSVWLADSTAYYVGTKLGRLKFYPSISPNKTIEGVFGSIAGGSIGALIINAVLNIPGFSVKGAAITGAVIGITTVIGDLIESMFKRDAGVKDSGALIPGHGGVLDKIDGLLVSGPVLYFIVRYF